MPTHDYSPPHVQQFIVGQTVAALAACSDAIARMHSAIKSRVVRGVVYISGVSVRIDVV